MKLPESLPDFFNEFGKILSICDFFLDFFLNVVLCIVIDSIEDTMFMGKNIYTLKGYVGSFKSPLSTF